MPVAVSRAWNAHGFFPAAAGFPGAGAALEAGAALPPVAAFSSFLPGKGQVTTISHTNMCLDWQERHLLLEWHPWPHLPFPVDLAKVQSRRRSWYPST